MRWRLPIYLLLSLAACPAEATSGPPLVLEARIDIGPVHGRLDHMAVDLARKHLFVAEYGNDSVGVVDLSAQKLIRMIEGFREPQGVAYVPATDAIYVANGGDGTVRILRGQDFSQAASIKLDSDADNIRVDEAHARIYVGHGEGGIAIIDAHAQELIGEIRLKAHPEGFALDPN